MADMEQIIRAAAKVQSLRDQLRAAEADLRRTIRVVADEKHVKAEAPESAKAGEPSVPERIKALLVGQPSKCFTPADIAEKLGIESRDYVRVALRRLAEKDAVEWDEKGGGFRAKVG